MIRTTFISHRYGLTKYVAVLMINVGITMATMASAHQMVSKAGAKHAVKLASTTTSN